MARGIDRLNELLGKLEDGNDEQASRNAAQTAVSTGTSGNRGASRLQKFLSEADDTPANAASKAAYKELTETGTTTYGGKRYTLPQTVSEAQTNRDAMPASRSGQRKERVTTPATEYAESSGGLKLTDADEDDTWGSRQRARRTGTLHVQTPTETERRNYGLETALPEGRYTKIDIPEPAATRTVTDIYNDADTMARWSALASKSALTAEEKKEARAARKEISSALGFSPSDEEGQGWKTRFSKDDLPLAEELFGLDIALNNRTNAGTGIMAGIARALGIDWLSDRLFDLAGVRGEDGSTAPLKSLTTEIQTAQPGAFTAGNIAGSTLEMLSVSGAVGNAMKGVQWFADAAPWVQRAVSSGITFGISGLQSGVTSTQTKEEWDAQEARNAQAAAEMGVEYTPKEYSVGHQLANVGIAAATGALSGAAGGALESVFGLGTSKALVRYGLQYNTLFRALASGINGVGFAAGSTAIQEASKYLQYPEGYTASASEIASNMAIAFLFSSVSSMLADIKTAPQNRENLLKMMDELTREYAEVEMKMAGMTGGARKEAAQNVMQITGRIRNSVATGKGMSGVSKEVKSLLAALDIIDDRMAAIVAGGNGMLGAGDIMAQAEAAGFNQNPALRLPEGSGAPAQPTNLEQAVQIVGANVPAPRGGTVPDQGAPAQTNDLPAWYAAYLNAPRPVDQPMQEGLRIPAPAASTPPVPAQETPQQAETPSPAQERLTVTARETVSARAENPLRYALDKAASGETLTLNDARAIIENPQALKDLRAAGMLTEELKSGKEGREQVRAAVESLADIYAEAEGRERLRIAPAEERTAAEERLRIPEAAPVTDTAERQTLRMSDISAQGSATLPAAAQTEQRQAETAETPPLPKRASERAETESAAQNLPQSPAGDSTIPGARASRRDAPATASPEEARNGSGLRVRESQALGNADAERLWTAEKRSGETRDAAPIVNALRATSTEILEAYMTESTEGSEPISVAVEAVEKAAKQGTISPMAGAELIRQMWSAGKSDAARADYLRSMINSSTGELTPQALNAARRIDQKHRGGLSVGGQAEIAPTAEAAGGTETAGGTGNDLADGGRIGIPGQRAGEQNGRMAEGRKALTQAEKAVRRQADAKNLRTETVDARAHIREAAEGSTLRLAPEEMAERDPELRAVKRRLEEITGKQVHYILGTIQRAKGGRARGAITGSDIWLQCDNLSASVTQLGAHELYHYYRDIYPGLNDRMRQRIIDTWSAEEFQRVAEIYLDKLGAVCGLTEDMDGVAIDRELAKVEEELFADAYGNLNAFKAGADKFTETARAVVKETVGKETAAATERKTGPPEETRWSIEEVQGQKDDYGKREYSPGDEKSLEEEINAAGLLLTSKENNKNNQRIRAWISGNHPELTDRVRFFNDKATGRVTVEGIDEQSAAERLRIRSQEEKDQQAKNDRINAKYGLTHENSLQDTGLIRSWEDRAAVVSAVEAELNKMPEVESAQVKASGGMGSYETLYIEASLENGRAVEYRLSGHDSRYGGADRYYSNEKYQNVEQLLQDVESAIREDAATEESTSFSADDEPDNAAEYNRLKIREENRIPESAAEYDQMKKRAIIEQDRLRKLEREGDAAAKERREALKAQWELKDPPKVTKSQATIARKDLRNALFDAFSVPAGQKAEIGAIIDAFAEKRVREGTLSETDRKELFDRLYEAGVVTVPADDAFQAARALVKGGRIYVPENIKHEFADGWNDFRKEAFAEGILLVNDDQARGVDQWNADLARELPGLFDEDNYDPRDMLERIVQMAREGRDQQLSLAEYAAQAIGSEFISEDELMDNLERQLDWALRTFADKAGLETYFRKREGKQLAEQKEYYHQMMDRQRAQEVVRKNREREKRKEAAQKAAMNRELKDLQQRTLKQLQWLSQNRNKFGGDMQAEVDKLLENIDIIAASAADEMHLDKKTGRTWKDLRDMYVSAQKNDPNWLPSTELKNIVIRLDYDKIADLDIGALQDLYKAAVGLRTELYNRNNVIDSELHETFQEVYDQAKSEIQGAKGGYETGAKGTRDTFFNDLQLTPMNRLERMAGWNPESRWYGMARMLEQGERDQRRFKTESARQIAPVLEKYKDWMKTADGQGKDGKWYEIEVPANWEYRMGDKPVFSTETVKVYMTPAQKVHMYLESKSYDNLRHMEGGRTFANKELYSKGKRAEAFAQGKTVRLLPETVKKIVSDLTPEEQALADALEKYYNEYSKGEINRVSNALYGYDKAMEGNYAPIYTNDNYTKSEPGIFDTTAEGVGNLKSRVVSSNPSLNISAFDAFEKSVDKTGRFVGLSIPIRNMNTLMNWREPGNSMKDILDHKWGEKETKWVEDLMTELQSGKADSGKALDRVMDKALSRYISAVFGANPSIVLKQFASYPLAATYLGFKNLPINIIRGGQADMDLIAKYTGELDYRMMGYSMPETAAVKNNPGMMEERGLLNFLFGGGAITAMDGFTIRNLWTAAENKVRREQPELEMGTQDQINAGESPYYKAVAAEFNEAVSRSQPMYDIMHRSNVMREKGGITRAFTLFKTVPQQEYNMLRQTMGEASYYARQGKTLEKDLAGIEKDLTGELTGEKRAELEARMKRTEKQIEENKEKILDSRAKAGKAWLGLILGNLMIGLITGLNALWKNKGKKYRDKDGNLTAGSISAQFLKQFVRDTAGMSILGGEVADILSAILFGDKLYNIEMPGLEQANEIQDKLVSAWQTVEELCKDSREVLVSGGNWGQYMADHYQTYLKAIDEVAATLGTYGTGLPIDNVKAYLLGTIQWISPAAKTAYEDALKKADRTGLKGLTGASLAMRTKHILQDRAGQVDMRTVEELARLYEAGYTDAIPAAQQTKLSINGEERALNLAQQQTYKNVWKDTVSGALDELVGSEAYQAADEPTRAKMLKRLYDLATDTAKAVLFDDYEEPALTKAQTMQDIGISLADYAAAAAQYSAIGNRKDIDSYERGRLQRALIDGMNYGDREKLQLYLMLSGAESRAEKFQAIMDAGLSFRETVRIYDKYAEIDGEDAGSGEKAQAFALWVDKQEYTNEQRQTIKDQLKTWQIIPVEASRYEKYTGLGFDPDTASAIDKAIAALEPLPGHDGITNAQKWNAGLKALGSNASKKDKLALVGSIMGTAMVTDAGNPTQWAKFNRVVDSGVSIENALGMIEDDTFDTYIKWMDSDAKKAGVNSSTYLKWRETSSSTHSERDADGKEIKGKTRKDKLIAYIDSLSISSSQKDALFLEEYKESGLKDTPWHGGGGSGSGSYAPARLRVQRQPWELGREDTLRLREEQPEQPRSGLRIRGGERTSTASRSGLRIRG